MINILDNESVSINENTYKLSHHEKLFDGIKFTLEATGSSSVGYQQSLYTRQLKGITSKMLPKQFSISIYEPKSSFTNIDYLTYNKVLDNCEMQISLSFDYSSWEYSSNVFHWCTDFIKDLENSNSRFTKITKDKQDVGVSITCHISLTENDDLYEIYNEFDTQIESIYLTSVKDANWATKKNKSNQDKDETKWWVQHVVVPIIGSGTFAAILAWYVFK